jgi:hypothetical protein
MHLVKSYNKIVFINYYMFIFTLLLTMYIPMPNMARSYWL